MCNASSILDVLKNDTVREMLRGPPGLAGKDGKSGAPGLTVSTTVNIFGYFGKVFILLRKIIENFLFVVKLLNTRHNFKYFARCILK